MTPDNRSVFSVDRVIVARSREDLERIAETLPVYPGSTGWVYDPSGFMAAVDMRCPTQPGVPVLVHAIPTEILI